MTSENLQDTEYRNICSEKTLQSNSQGFFLNFADLVAKEAGENWIHNVFGKLKSDEDRIKCVYTSKETGELLENFLANVQEVFRPKNASFSQKKRLEAEQFLKQGDAQKALLISCQSVLRASKTGEEKNIDSGLSLPLALWGRAQALIKLEKFNHALTDIQQALKENLPGSHKAQAFWKMGLCYQALGQENKAKVSFNLAEKLLQNDREKMKMLFEDKQKKNSTKTGTKLVEKCPEKASTLTGESNKNLPNASKKLSVKSSKVFGRYIVANQSISTGEILVVEPPLAACLLSDMFGTHCHHCFKRLECPYGCSHCASVAFCTIKCRDEAISTYHKHECKYLDLLIGSGMSILGHTALRIITQSGLEKCLEVYRNRAQEKVYQLCTHSNLRTPEDFLQRTLMAAFLLRCLQKSNFFALTRSTRVILSEEEYQIGAMLLFNLQMLQFNAHEVYETRRTTDSKLKGAKPTYIGVALYLTASMFNHDCYPALSRHFQGKDIVLASVRPLEANEIVPENYGPIFTRRALALRQRSLSSRYWFNCQCLACQQNWPCIDRGLETVSKRLKCPNKLCKQIFTLPVSNECIECPKCKTEVKLSSKILLLKWCEEEYQLAFEVLEKGETEKAIDILCHAIDTFYKISVPPHKETHLAEEMLMVCLADKGNTWIIPGKST